MTSVCEVSEFFFVGMMRAHVEGYHEMVILALYNKKNDGVKEGLSKNDGFEPHDIQQERRIHGQGRGGGGGSIEKINKKIDES